METDATLHRKTLTKWLVVILVYRNVTHIMILAIQVTMYLLYKLTALLQKRMVLSLSLPLSLTTDKSVNSVEKRSQMAKISFLKRTCTSRLCGNGSVSRGMTHTDLCKLCCRNKATKDSSIFFLIMLYNYFYLSTELRFYAGSDLTFILYILLCCVCNGLVSVVIVIFKYYWEIQFCVTNKYWYFNITQHSKVLIVSYCISPCLLTFF